jgi:hypothetical protein
MHGGDTEDLKSWGDIPMPKSAYARIQGLFGRKNPISAETIR